VAWLEAGLAEEQIKLRVVTLFFKCSSDFVSISAVETGPPRAAGAATAASVQVYQICVLLLE
jgi:hypothetical protein